MYPRLVHLLLLALIVFALRPSSACIGQTTHPWQAMRINVPDDQIDLLANSDEYQLVNITKLDSLLRAEAARRRASQDSGAAIVDAMYVAEISEHSLVSKFSRWRFSQLNERQHVDVGFPNFAVRPVDSSQISVTDFLRFQEDGRAIVLANRELTEAWFGFTAKPSKSDVQSTEYNLKFPAALVGKLILSVPKYLQLESSNVPVAMTDQPHSELPNDWPEVAKDSNNSQVDWYVLHVSGRDSIDLSLTPRNEHRLSPWDLVIRSCKAEFIIWQNEIRLRTEIVVPWHEADQLSFSVDPRLRIRGVRIDKQEGIWDQQQDPQKDHTITVQLPHVSTGNHQIQVDAFMPVTFPFEGTLPSIQVERGFVLDGRSSLIGAEALLIERLRPEGLRATMSWVPIATGQARELPEWRWDWQSSMPVAKIRIVRPNTPWQVRSLTKFSVHPTAIAASSQLRLSGHNLQTNHLEFDVGQGWFVDEVSCTLDNTAVATEIQPLAGSNRSKLIVRWGDVRDSATLELMVSAHVPRAANAEQLRLPQSALITLLGADQQDTYVVETTGQYQLQVGAELLQLRQTEDDLAPWQRNLLPRLAETWIFRGVRGSLPPLTMRRIRGSFSCKHIASVWLPAQRDRIQIDYLVSCLPISGSLARLQIVVPVPVAMVPEQWSIESLGGKPSSGTYVSSSVVGINSNESTIELTFSKPISQAFTLVAHAEHPLTSKKGVIPLTSSPDATNQEGLVVLPRELWHSVNTFPADVLPPGSISEIERVAVTKNDSANDSVHCRYDPNTLSKLEIGSELEAPKGWVWNQIVDHWHLCGSPTRHEVRWSIMAPTSGVLNIRCPSTWQPAQLTIDGQSQLPPRNQVDGTLAVSHPAGERLNITLVCTSSNDSCHWLSQIDTEQVSVSMKVLNNEHRHWIAPGKTTLAALFELQSPSLLRRLSPIQWWERLRPDPQDTMVKAATDLSNERITPLSPKSNSAATEIESPMMDARLSGWRLLEDRGADLDRNISSIQTAALNMWIIDRAAASVIAITFVCWLSVMIYRICRNRAGSWLACATTILLVCSLVPVEIVGLAQLCCLAYSIALGTQVIRALVVLRSARRVSVRRGSTLASQVPLTLGALFFAVSYASNLFAQDNSAGSPNARKIFGILVPTDQQQTPAGDLVYAPKQLLELLENPMSGALRGNYSQIRNVLYRIQLQSSFMQRTAINEIAVDLDVTLSSSETQFRFPVRQSEVQLARAFVDGNEVYGASFRQEPEYILWNAPGAKQYKVQLLLIPRTSMQETDGRGRWSFSIPPTATARAEIRAESAQEIEANSIGETRRDGLGAMNVELGPAAKIDLSWPMRATPDVVPQVFVDTWVRIRQSQVVAYGQLRITGASALPEKLFVSCDAQWIPVGTQWQDAVLLPAESSPGSSRNQFAIQRQRLGADDSITVRVLLLPREPDSAQTLTIPFLSLQESQPLVRTLAVSVPGFPGWKLEGTDTWPSVTQPLSVWGDARLAEQAITWRVPLRNVSATLVRQPIAALTAVDENTEIHLRQPESKIRYAARWNTPYEGQSSLTLRIPNEVRVVSALVNQLPATYNVSPTNSDSRMTITHDIARGPVQSLDIELALPNKFDTEQQLARPLLEDNEIATSQVKLSRGTELTCQVITSADQPITLHSAALDSNSLLTELELPLGETELGAEYRESVYMPLVVKLGRTKENVDCTSVLRMIYSDSGWTGEFESQIATSNSLDYFFLDMPVEFRDSYQTPTTSMTLPSAESNRVTLCIVPPAPIEGTTRIHVSLKLPGTITQQSLRLPDLRPFWSTRHRPVIALPNQVDQQTVRWSNTGRRLNNTQRVLWFEASGYSLFEHNESQQQVSWQTTGTPGQSAKINLAIVHLKSTSQDGCVGSIEYWIEPRRQSALTVKLPKNVQLVGAMIGSQLANWHTPKDHEVAFLLQPNYLPMRLSLWLRWNLLPSTDDRQSHVARVEFPTPRANTADCKMWIVCPSIPKLDSPVDQNVVQGNIGTARQADEIQAEMEQRWRTLLDSSYSNATLCTPSELQSWLSLWHPGGLWLAKNSHDRGDSADNETQLGADILEKTETTDEFWRSYIGRFGIDELAVASTSTMSAVNPDEQLTWIEISMPKSDESAYFVMNMRNSNPIIFTWYLPLLVVCAGSIVFFLGKPLESLVGWLIADQSWALLLGLAIIFWLLLPIVWPSWLTGIFALYALGHRLIFRSWRGRLDLSSY